MYVVGVVLPFSFVMSVMSQRRFWSTYKVAENRKSGIVCLCDISETCIKNFYNATLYDCSVKNKNNKNDLISVFSAASSKLSC